MIDADVYGLAVELARPVVRRALPLRVADLVILDRALRCDSPYDPLGIARHGCHILRHELHYASVKRDVARHRIRRAIQPLIAQRAAKHVLLRTAHDLNGETGFPLTEAEVNAAVAESVWW